MATLEHSPILIIDDDTSVLDGQRALLLLHGYKQVDCARTFKQARELFVQGDRAVVLLDLALKNESGLDVLAWIHEHHPATQVVVLTAANDTRLAVRCMRDGAFDFLVKGNDTDRLPGTVRNALEKRRSELEKLRLRDALVGRGSIDEKPFASFVSVSEHIDRIRRYLDAIAPLPDPILLTGETGVGKEVMAKAIHDRSGRSGPFVTANVGGLDDQLLSDTLFGHKRGAFTGADRNRDGLVKSAAEGTLLLDEFGEASMHSQTKILRLVELGEYLPLGSDRVETAGTRFVFATNKDLQKEVAAGRFRRDLFYRISSHHVHIPPIRERPEDIRPILKHLVKRHAERLKQEAVAVPQHVVARLARSPIPGNVRELEHVVISALVNGVWEQEEEGAPGAISRETRRVAFGPELPTPEELVDQLIEEADSRFPGNRSKAAAAIGLSRQAMANRRRRSASRDSSYSHG